MHSRLEANNYSIDVQAVQAIQSRYQMNQTLWRHQVYIR